MLELREAPSKYLSTDLRRCSRCGELKPTEDFPIKNRVTGLRRTWCRPCCRAYGKEHYRRERPTYLVTARERRRMEVPRILRAIDDHLRTHPCVDCGETDPNVLDLDHRDRALKIAPVSRLARSATMSIVLAEIAKCDVRCGNCHRLRTAQQMNWRKVPASQRLERGDSGYVPKKAPSSGWPITDQLSIWSLGVTQVCSRCRVAKPLHEFAFDDRVRRTRQRTCRTCHAAYRREHYVRNRPAYIAWAERQARSKRDGHVELVHAYLREHPCVDCGATDIVKLEFDHADGETKVMELSKMLGRRNWRAIEAEMAKCDVRCVNCHRRRTARQQGWRQRIGEGRRRYRRSVELRRSRE
jgi:hypothetical protein